MSMKKEDLIYSMADIDDRFIEEAMPGKKVQKKETGVVVPVKRGMSKAAVAAAIALCVVVLGGGVVWAMTASPLKDYFFADSKKQAFADVYKDIGKTYKIGDHSVTLDGIIYDESIETGYVSFSAVDAMGNPTPFTEYKNIEQVLPISRQLGDFQLTRRISTEGFMLGEDEVFFITVYRQSYYIDWGQSTLYWQIKGDKETYNSPVLITVVDRAALDSIINEIAQLDKEEICKTTYDPENNRILVGGLDPLSTATPEVLDILSKYDLVAVDYEAMPSQIIETENCTFIFGRTDGILKYNSEKFDADSFIIKRENGEEVLVEKLYYEDGTTSELWKSSNVDKMKCYSQTSSNSPKKDFTAQYHYGFILDADEKVSVIIDGKEYK
ncbi:MAG: hypothetical protein IJL20_01580 [Lachnospiraceae bacterium]|nr:hypothetical protein [Lachnospiraceae bacterium]